jgi:dihydropteroate synthase
VTPDSFSDGGRYSSVNRAVARALEMQQQGADIIDIGGESTRPGAAAISAAQELRRVIPVIERLAPRLKIPISIDTSKAVVAHEAILAGAKMVNDVTALRDPRMACVVAQSKLPVVLMHMRGTPRTMRSKTHYRRLIPEIVAELKTAIQKAVRAGISRDKMVVDPGIGFSKTPAQNLQLLHELPAFKKALGLPVLIGPSRKSFVAKLSGPEPDQRLAGTAGAVAAGIILGADIVRVHDVAEIKQIIDLCQN